MQGTPHAALELDHVVSAGEDVIVPHMVESAGIRTCKLPEICESCHPYHR